jgi:flagellar assembly protein FliH
MSRKVFKEVDVSSLGRPVFIEVPKYESPQAAEALEGDDDLQLGPSIEEIEAELKELKFELSGDLETMREDAVSQIGLIKDEAKNWAFDKVKEAAEEYDQKIKDAQSQAERIVEEAKRQGEKLVAEAQEEADKYRSEAHKKGFEEGREEGYLAGKDEVDRLIDRLTIVLSTAIRKRNEIIEEAESQVIDLVITIARKVVKSITETQKRVVYDNIVAALQKLKGRAEVTIRVNTEDLMMTTKHKKEFIEMIEGIEQVRILEDNSVDKGGCIIATDFGSIDARISTQLSEIEAKIKELAPLKQQD